MKIKCILKGHDPVVTSKRVKLPSLMGHGAATVIYLMERRAHCKHCGKDITKQVFKEG